MTTTAVSVGARVLFGSLAMSASLVTEAQLQQALHKQRLLRSVGAKPYLGEVMVSMGLLKPDNVAALLKRQQHSDDQ